MKRTTILKALVVATALPLLYLADVSPDAPLGLDAGARRPRHRGCADDAGVGGRRGAAHHASRRWSLRRPRRPRPRHRSSRPPPRNSSRPRPSSSRPRRSSRPPPRSSRPPPQRARLALRRSARSSVPCPQAAAGDQERRRVPELWRRLLPRGLPGQQVRRRPASVDGRMDAADRAAAARHPRPGQADRLGLRHRLRLLLLPREARALSRQRALPDAGRGAREVHRAVRRVAADAGRRVRLARRRADPARRRLLPPRGRAAEALPREEGDPQLAADQRARPGRRVVRVLQGERLLHRREPRRPEGDPRPLPQGPARRRAPSIA